MPWATFYMGDNITGTFYERQITVDGVTVNGLELEIVGYGYMYDDVTNFRIPPDQGINVFAASRLIQGTLTIPDGIKSIAGGCFRNLGEDAARQYGFNGCPHVVIGADVESIGGAAFSSDNTLTNIHKIQSVYISGNKVTRVGASAFENQHEIPFIDFHDTVLYLGQDAFRNCHNLEYITLNDEWVFDPEPVRPFTFADCYKLRSISEHNIIHTFLWYNYLNCNSLQDFTIRNEAEFDPRNNESMYVDLYAGSVLDEDGYFITEVNTSNRHVLDFDWTRWNRKLILKADGFIYLYHLGQILRIGVFGDADGEFAIKWGDLFKYLRANGNNGSPLWVAHNGRWLHIEYY